MFSHLFTFCTFWFTDRLTYHLNNSVNQSSTFVVHSLFLVRTFSSVTYPLAYWLTSSFHYWLPFSITALPTFLLTRMHIEKQSTINQSFKHWNVQKLIQWIMIQCFNHQTIDASLEHWMVESLDCSISYSVIQRFNHSVIQAITRSRQSIIEFSIQSFHPSQNQTIKKRVRPLVRFFSMNQVTKKQWFNYSISQLVKDSNLVIGILLNLCQWVN